MQAVWQDPPGRRQLLGCSFPAGGDGRRRRARVALHRGCWLGPFAICICSGTLTACSWHVGHANPRKQPAQRGRQCCARRAPAWGNGPQNLCALPTRPLATMLRLSLLRATPARYTGARCCCLMHGGRLGSGVHNRSGRAGQAPRVGQAAGVQQGRCAISSISTAPRHRAAGSLSPTPPPRGVERRRGGAADAAASRPAAAAIVAGCPPLPPHPAAAARRPVPLAVSTRTLTKMAAKATGELLVATAGRHPLHPCSRCRFTADSLRLPPSLMPPPRLTLASPPRHPRCRHREVVQRDQGCARGRAGGGLGAGCGGGAVGGRR